MLGLELHGDVRSLRTGEQEHGVDARPGADLVHRRADVGLHRRPRDPEQCRDDSRLATPAETSTRDLPLACRDFPLRHRRSLDGGDTPHQYGAKIRPGSGGSRPHRRLGFHLLGWSIREATVEEPRRRKVRLEVEVPEADVRHAIEHAAPDLAQSMKIPGFRKGKVPLQVVAARVGRDALWAEAVRTHIDSWFWDAAQDRHSARRRPRGRVGEPPEQGETFIYGHGAGCTEADASRLDGPRSASGRSRSAGRARGAEIERLRESVAELVPVSGRPVETDGTR